MNRLTEISLNASNPEDWTRPDYVRVQFNDGCHRGRFFYITGATAHRVLETVARVCLEGWMQANDSAVHLSNPLLNDRARVPDAKVKQEERGHA